MEYPKYKALLEGATVHEEQDAELVSKVRSGSHIFISWKLNLLNLMKQEFLSTNSCDFALGEFCSFLDTYQQHFNSQQGVHKFSVCDWPRFKRNSSCIYSI
jgi:hypothetical protein